MRFQTFGRSSRSGRPTLILAGTVTLIAVTSLVAWTVWPGKPHPAYSLAPESALTDNLRKAPPKVRDAYRFAVANRDMLRQISCYCGCGAEHKSNAECYIKDVRPDGSIVFDPMSFG